MPKILWVALPLLLAAAVLALQFLRGRAPSRTAINIVSSVLLLVYVATTAGLGIFWVANQQLPVFDWHYLFGYGTVLLVSLHLAFNFPRVWRFFARRRTEGREPRRLRRRWLRSHARRSSARRARRARSDRCGVRARPAPRPQRAEGRVVVARRLADRGRPDDGSSRGDAHAVSLALVERFHAFSAHSRAGVLTRAPSGGWGEPPPPFKRHAGATRTPLPAPGAARPGRFDLESLGALLWHTAGVTEKRGGLALRASPSSGALFATELYVLARSLPGLASGALHYDPETHALERLGGAAMTAAGRRDRRRGGARRAGARRRDRDLPALGTQVPRPDLSLRARRPRACAGEPARRGRGARRAGRASWPLSTRRGSPVRSASTRRRRACWR